MPPVPMPTPVRLRLSVVALFVDGDDVLLLHQATLPETDCWDLPGGGLEPEEPLLEGLRREVYEEVGIADFEVEGLLTVVERFYPDGPGTLHTINLVYRCRVEPRPRDFVAYDPVEIGDRGIQWLPISTLDPNECSTRAWQAIQAAALRRL